MTNIIQADYIYVLEEGTVAEEGTYKQLMESKGPVSYTHLRGMHLCSAGRFLAT